MFLLDTNVVSELRKVAAGKADAGVSSWTRATDANAMFISVITVHELEHGVRLAERRDRRKGALLRQWLDGSVLPGFAGRILAVDVEAARAAAGLHVPDPAPFRDALIGASALVHGMTVVTRNVVDFERFPGIRVLNPWKK